MYDDQFERQDWRSMPTGVPIGHIAIVAAGRDHDGQVFVWDGTQWVPFEQYSVDNAEQPYDDPFE